MNYVWGLSRVSRFLICWYCSLESEREREREGQREDLNECPTLGMLLSWHSWHSYAGLFLTLLNPTYIHEWILLHFKITCCTLSPSKSKGHGLRGRNIIENLILASIPLGRGKTISIFEGLLINWEDFYDDTQSKSSVIAINYNISVIIRWMG